MTFLVLPTQGALRFAGGKIEQMQRKNIIVNTSNAALAVRGTPFLWPYQVRIASFNSGIDATSSSKTTAIQKLSNHGLVTPEHAVDHRRSDCRGISRVVKSLKSPFGVL